eukprot:COSAG06_NODE_4987_length_3805_cov_7.850513_1_plen_113_part_00
MSEGSSSDEEMSGVSHDVVDLAQEEDGAGGEEFGLSADQMAFVVVFDKVQDILQGFDAALSMLDEQHTPWTKCEVVCAAAGECWPSIQLLVAARKRARWQHPNGKGSLSSWV